MVKYLLDDLNVTVKLTPQEANNPVTPHKATQGSQNQCAPMVAHEGWIETSH